MLNWTRLNNSPSIRTRARELELVEVRRVVAGIDHVGPAAWRRNRGAATCRRAARDVPSTNEVPGLPFPLAGLRLPCAAHGIWPVPRHGSALRRPVRPEQEVEAGTALRSRSQAGCGTRRRSRASGAISTRRLLRLPARRRSRRGHTDGAEQRLDCAHRRGFGHLNRNLPPEVQAHRGQREAADHGPFSVDEHDFAVDLQVADTRLRCARERLTPAAVVPRGARACSGIREFGIDQKNALSSLLDYRGELPARPFGAENEPVRAGRAATRFRRGLSPSTA